MMVKYNEMNGVKFGIEAGRLAMAIAAVLAVALAIFLSPGNLAPLANDGNISEESIYHVTLFRIVIAHVGALALIWFIMFGFKGSDTPVVDISTRRNYATDLFAVSFFILFMELALIRWIPAYVKLMSYFTNFILLACFLGMGLGCLASGSKVNFLKITSSLLAVIVIVSLLIFALGHLNVISYSLGRPSGQEHIYFGGISSARLARYKDIGISLIIGIIFVLVTLVFTGPGQVMGRLFNRFDNPIKAYSVNISASVAGIVCFSLFSFFSVPAWAWFIAIALMVVLLLNRRKGHSIGLNVSILLVTLLLVGFVSIPMKNGLTLWSPYYKIFYAHPRISVNEISHQSMLSSKNDNIYNNYHLPYLISRDASGRSFDRVLVIGAGSGNDVSHALMYGAKEVDAVEIDPVILNLGKRNHPDRPYDDPRVRIITDDGRSFLRRTGERYNMIVYGLVDSLTLMSGFSSVRLENFLFTLEAFEDIKQHLEPDGMFVMYNFFRENWLTIRLYKMLERVFGKKPVLLIYPPEKTITAKTKSIHSISTLMAGNTDAIQAAFGQHGKYYVLNREGHTYEFNGFTEPPKNAEPVTFYDVHVTPSAPVHYPADNWPFVYMRQPCIPGHNLWGLGLIALISILFVGSFIGFGVLPRVSAYYFFLGGAFMLLETESIVKLALIHGSTWFVNSVVFASVMVMILIANLFVLRWPIRNSMLVFLFLFISLAINYAVPLSAFLGKSWFVENVISSLMLFAPIGFAGIIFANSFRCSKRPALDLGSNLLGIICGGIAEYASLAYGYNALLLFAAAMYFISLIALPRNNLMPNHARL